MDNTTFTPVAFYRQESYDQASVSATVRKLLKDIGFDELIYKKKKIVIKPNLVIRRPPEAYTTTHPSVVKAVLDALEPYDVDVTVAESPGGVYNEAVMKALYKTTGIAKIAEGTKASLNTSSDTVDIPSRRHCAVTTYNVLAPIAEADLIINLAKLKTHSLTSLSACTKNLYGSIPGLQKFELHARFPDPEQFAAMVVELTETLAPQINIVDAVYGMEGNGPNNGTTRYYGALFGSRSPFCCDVVCCDYLGLSLSSVPMLTTAVKYGLCPDRISKLTLLGDTKQYASLKIKNLKLPDTQNGSVIARLSRFAGGRVTRFFEPHPVITNRCVGCGECVMYCPQKTIKLVDRHAVIDRANCIKCFCCQELCRTNAIKIHRVGILKL
ncbi:MAG TPA: DUF362 domain-containing protein [Bacillota bacterium]|nr:DUF362 domain-containing protein [Bacillota bacterium]